MFIHILKMRKCFYVTSMSEAFSVTIVESFSLGIPVVSTKTQGSIEIMGKLKTNYFIDSFTDEKELATKIKEVLVSDIDRNALIDCAKKYDIKNISKKYMDVFENL